MKYDSMILRFFRDEVLGILITDSNGNVLYADAKSSAVNLEGTNWKIACPRPGMEQKAEVWDLSETQTGKTYMVTFSTFPCVIACGMAYGGEGCDFDQLLAQADRLMYEDKKAKKQQSGDIQ